MLRGDNVSGVIQSIPVLLYNVDCQRCPMGTLTVTVKGQVTLRKDILKHLGVQPGEKIAVEKLPDGRVEVRAQRTAGNIADAFNFLKRKKGASLTIRQINEIAARGWAGKK